MRAIVKGREPRELTEYCRKRDAAYDGPLFTQRSGPNEKSIKDVIREQLLQEQGYLCAYCMTRIDATKMKVEHWHCQDNYPDEQLNYQNMLGVCKGNEGQPPGKQTCDTRKGNKDIKYHPANSNHRIESHIRFLGNGKIQTDNDGDFDGHLNDVLNLNEPRLARNRQAVWEAVHNTLSREPGNRTPTEIKKLLDRWNTPDTDGRLQGYCAVAIYYLRKKLGKLSNPL